MGSYQRFPKCNPAADELRRRDQEWREEQFRQAIRDAPRPAASTDADAILRLQVDRVQVAELFAELRPTLH